MNFCDYHLWIHPEDSEKKLFVSVGKVHGKGQCFKTACQAVWDVNLIPSFSHRLGGVSCCTDTRGLTCNEGRSSFDGAGNCSLWTMQDFGGFPNHGVDLEPMEISALQNSHCYHLYDWVCRCFQLEPAQGGDGPNLPLGFTPAWRADPCKCSYLIYPFIFKNQITWWLTVFPAPATEIQCPQWSFSSSCSFLTFWFFTYLIESSKQINVLTSSGSAENKSGKEQLERGNLLCEKQMHMGVRDEQVIKGLWPLMHGAPGKQADMKWERSCFLPRQNKHLTAWAAAMQHCWVCHGLSHYQIHSQLATRDRWKHWVWGFFSLF